MKLTTIRTTAVTILLGVGAASAASANSDTLYTSCFACHGPEGISKAAHIPSIAGLNFQYFYSVMQSYRKDRRNSTIMGRIAKGYKTSQIQRMALYFGAQPWTGRQLDGDPGLARRGRELHVEYCEKCHKHNGHFQDRETPPLAGQAKGYLRYQMADHRADVTGIKQPPLMQERLEKLSDDDFVALSEFYTSVLATAPAADKTE